MFSSKSKLFSSPSRVSIEEANSHIQLVNLKVQQLELIISKRDKQLIENEQKYRNEVIRLTHSYDKHFNELNREIDFFKSQVISFLMNFLQFSIFIFDLKVSEMESQIREQNKIIKENDEKLPKLSQIIKLAPNLHKLLDILNDLSIDYDLNQNPNKKADKVINDSKSHNKNESTECLNGICVHNNEVLEDTTHSSISSITSKTKNCIKMPKKCVSLSFVSGVEEEVVSTTSSSTTVSVPRIKDSNEQTLCGSSEINRTKLKIGRSFNITSNFSEDEEVFVNCKPSNRHKKITQI